MEMKLSPGTGEVLGCKDRPPSRLQRKAPASLQLEQAGPGAAHPSPAAWGDGRTPIPLLSPLVASPAPAWEPDQGGSRRDAAQAETRSGGDADGILSPIRRGAHGVSNGADETATTPALAPSGGWRHPAMTTPTPTPASKGGGGWRHPAMPSPVPEPASLTPLFKSQCAVELHNPQAQAQ
ncbi:uncharacterized protein LOC119285254 [Triticum dicoccoides]|uniref:uncharacterized protein LOC119285254 n=1 Tax=Triticum dicoccoides TaxID=85692 RepID=UPI000E7CB33B|nr:uncharacterized protein LOC119285254 [Triticum dicoccoides]